jgi:hypothetical protein
VLNQDGLNPDMTSTEQCYTIALHPDGPVQYEVVPASCVALPDGCGGTLAAARPSRDPRHRQ